MTSFLAIILVDVLFVFCEIELGIANILLLLVELSLLFKRTLDNILLLFSAELAGLVKTGILLLLVELSLLFKRTLDNMLLFSAELVKLKNDEPVLFVEVPVLTLLLLKKGKRASRVIRVFDSNSLNISSVIFSPLVSNKLFVDSSAVIATILLSSGRTKKLNMGKLLKKLVCSFVAIVAIASKERASICGTLKKSLVAIDTASP